MSYNLEERVVVQMRHYERKRAWMIELLGGCCAKCQSLDQLEIDHIDPATKLFNVSKNYSRAKIYLLPELMKCQLLCAECHLIKTQTEDGHKAYHGSVGMYRHRGCRCEECVAGNRRRMNEYYRKKISSNPNYRRDARRRQRERLRGLAKR